jgi:hypothetical protein
MKVIAYFTDPLALNKTMLGQMTNLAEAMGGSPAGGGGGSGAGASTSPTRPGRGGGSGK